MDVLHRREKATAAEVQQDLPDAPGYSTVRKLLEILETKGAVRHEDDGPRYVYFPAAPARNARRSALDHVVQAFFRGSAEQAVVTVLSMSREQLSNEELDRIAALAEQAKRRGR